MSTNAKMIKLVAICLITLFITACSSNYTRKVSDGEKIKTEVYFGNKNLEGLSVEQITSIVKKYSRETNVEPKNAFFNKQKWIVEPERNGKRLDINRTVDLILHASEGEKVSPIVEDVKPNITSDTIRQNIVEIGSFSTEILDDQKSRLSNLETAGSYIDDARIMPKEEFSFNETLGKRTKEKGYKKAPIIIKTKKGPKKGYGVGGGICQISTTLYNAALDADLNITERHPHSKNVGYVEKGKDATVVYGGADLKFVNNRSNQIVIKASITGESVTVKLYEIKDIQLL